MRFSGREMRPRFTWRSQVWRAAIGALVVGSSIAFLSSVQTSARQTQPAPAAPVTSSTSLTSLTSFSATSPEPRVLFDQYCITCHNQKLRTAGLTLETLDLTRPGANAEVWQKVIA